MRAETFRMSDETKQMFDKHSVTYDDAFVYVDVNGNTALHLAAYCGQIDTVNRMLLLNSKPPIVLNNDGETAITLAIKRRGFHKTITMLLDAGFEVPSHRLKGLQKFCVGDGLVTKNIKLRKS